MGQAVFVNTRRALAGVFAVNTRACGPAARAELTTALQTQVAETCGRTETVENSST
jgi:hypothetical protein